MGVLSAAVEVVAPVSSDGVPAYPTGFFLPAKKKKIVLFLKKLSKFHNSEVVETRPLCAKIERWKNLPLSSKMYAKFTG